jgi:hypothetical protein
MKFYCGECFDDMGNCAPWCGEAARERTLALCRSADALGLIHQSGCRCVVCEASKQKAEQK